MAGFVSSDAVQQLRGRFSGEVLESGNPGYEQVRQVHSGLIDKRVGLIARCEGTADVVGIEISARGGGRNVALVALSWTASS